ncbi:PAS domain-containing sensor histidine kinase [Geobacillus proteiniphilus]|uniref:Sensor histidine kinase n=1 Tax=Geobacillus proteiniphilus TaxID=860353 RepID=A0ABY9MKS5_9BACL|nr:MULTISPECIES: PAS domain-containing sensor histidine kinase [Geobacillus]MED4972146.1 PAS domain-containing sensor histidine kinase [Geobacillus thermoleovorans]OPX00421.1 ATPase [Geobacillus sp. LEMMY01]QCK82235.1 PAS domain-containing sensor histidine kinase [Geobacillus kaustophilus NBRC 102445]WMJ17814.1 PAS domain-containing sensor histidine kinase [Geobacillus proteiniphilus]
MQFLDKIFAYIQDGIIVMNHERTIVEMNPAAKRLTGWQLGEKVPYCSFCQRRKVKEGEERCYLIATEEVPYFVSEMPTDHGQWIDVEMSTELILEQDNAKYYLLVLRDQTIKKKEEEARRSKWMVKKLTEAKEEEHKRLAQELHDGVGQSLYSISIALDNIIQRVQDEKLHTYVKEVREELGRVMEDVKLYAQQLRPKSLDALGLIPTIQSLIHSLRSKMSNTLFSFQTNVYTRLSPTIEINLYRIIQEALHNVMKYAKATEVRVSIEQTERELFVSIEDNGVGFHVEEKREGLGLKHIQERVFHLGGEMAITSAPMKGTTIFVRVPLEGGEENESINC